MQLLEKFFVSGVGGFSAEPLTYNQVIRKGQFAVYERSRDGLVKDYEVIIIKLVPKGTELFGKISEDDIEMYPSTGQFSKMAWSFYGKFGKYAAINKFNELLKTDQEKLSPEIKKEWIIPKNEFVTNDLATSNNTNYVTASNFIKNNPDKIVFVRGERRQSRGKMSKIYKKISLI